MQEGLGDVWVLYDLGLLLAMLVCLAAYSVYVHTMLDFRPLNSYEVYDSLGGAQAHVLLPKKVNPSAWNSEYSLSRNTLNLVTCDLHTKQAKLSKLPCRHTQNIEHTILYLPPWLLGSTWAAAVKST